MKEANTANQVDQSRNKDNYSLASCIAACRYAKSLIVSVEDKQRKLQLAEKFKADLSKIIEELEFIFSEETRNPRSSSARLIRIRDLVNFTKLRVSADFDLFFEKLD